MNSYGQGPGYTRNSPHFLNGGGYPPALTPSYADLTPVDIGTTLAQMMKLVSRYRWQLATFIGLAMAAAIAVQIFVPKVYEASVLVKVDRHSAGGVVGQEATQVSSVDDMDQIIATQIELAQSDPVLRPVAERFKVLEAEGQLKGLSPEQIALKRAAPIQLKKLSIARPPNSYLLRISYRAHDPQLAADVSNAIADSLVEHSNDTGNRSSAQISASVARHMTSLRAKMTDADKQLANFEKELNMDPEQRVMVQSARLAQLNTEFTSVQSERVRKEAVLAELSRKGTVSLAAAQAATQDSTLLNETVQRLNAARQQFALVRSYYGEGHPEYVKAQQQVQEVQAQLNELQSRARERATDEYKQALGREHRLQALLQQTKVEVDGLKSRAHQYAQLRDESDGYRKLYQELASRADVADINRQFQNATVQVVAAALPPQDAQYPKLMINLPLAFLLSGILGIFTVVIRNTMDTTCADPEEFAKQHHINVLSAMPATKSLPNVRTLGLAAPSPFEPELTMKYQEGVRYLRSALTLLMMDSSVRSLLITSSLPAEGKSTTSAFLAAACAQLGRQVLLIDADFRQPALHKLFGQSNTMGLSDVLLGKPVGGAIVRLDQPGLFLMPLGTVPRQAANRISARFPEVLRETTRQFDLVIVDCSPMLGVAESQEIAGAVDSVLLVTKASSTTSRNVSQTLEILSRSRAKLLGVVMNQVRPSSGNDYGYYYFGEDVRRKRGA
jgi:capsular exopolysaccharide synthesis family protein